MSAICGERLIFGQQEGAEVELLVFGDEFYARYETTEGYSVLYDRGLGCYCYAELDSQGRFLSSGTPISKRPPFGLKRHLRESARIRNENFRGRYQQLRPVEAVGETATFRTLGPSDGLLTGRRANHGSVRGLTILVEFADVRAEVNADEVRAMLNELDYRRHGNHCSVRHYYQLMSSGKLDYQNDVVGPVRLPRKQSYYINQPLVEEALRAAIDQFGVDLSNYDSQGDGIVDALSFLYAGRTLYKNWLWPHNSVARIQHGGMRTHYYTIQSLGRRAVDLSIGTFAHESGHMLCRFPDLYDYGTRDGDFEKSAGLGRFCLMSSGNHLNYGKSPSPLCAYLRDLAGWTESVNLNRTGSFGIKHADYGKVYCYQTDRPNEYFLIENRSALGLDQHLPDAGLSVLHCDTRGSNEWEDGTFERHYQCALLQADGHRDLENDFNSGGPGDFFGKIEGLALGDETKPSSRGWDGTDSGLRLRDISEPGEVITVSTGEPSVSNRVEAEVVADLLIPDEDPQGLTSSLSVAEAGSIRSLSLFVHISHTYRGDVVITLESPSGKRSEVFRVGYDPTDDIHLELDSASYPALAAFQGEAIEGEWKLHVQDQAKMDIGRLDRWGLSAEIEAERRWVEGRNEAGIAIPDDDMQGVTSSIEIAESGTIEAIEVDVDIEHSYAGDLSLELISPSGRTLSLRPADGRATTNLQARFGSDSLPVLALLRGDAAKGKWELRVRDVARADEGALKRWGLRLLV